MEQTENQPTSVPQKSRKVHYPTLLLALVALLIALLAVGALCWGKHRLDQRFTAINSELTLQRSQTQLILSQQNDTLNTQQAQLVQLQTVATQLQQLTNHSQRSWALITANHLVQMANYNLHFMHDVPATINLLQNADQQLANLNDPSLINLRQSLAKYIANLQALPQLDLAGLLLKINALQTQVALLPLQTPTLPPTQNTTVQPVDQTLGPWHRAWQESVAKLQKLIVIRYTAKPVTPLLPLEQVAYLQQNLQLLLQATQIAALRGQAMLYQNNLQQAKAWVQRYFAADNANTQAALKTLTELQAINVQPALPDLSTLAQTMQHLLTSQSPHDKD